MKRDDHFDAIGRQRRALCDVLEKLSPEQFRTISLCEGWTVHDVLAHLVMPHETSIVRVIGSIARSKGNFNQANKRLTARFAKRSDATLTAQLRSHAAGRFKPPGFDSAASLTDTYIHSRDICDPLNIVAPGEPEQWAFVTRFLSTHKAQKMFVGTPPQEIHLSASDVDFEFGLGPSVQGTVADLAMTLAGRAVSPGSLRGEGLDALLQWSKR